MKHIISFCIPAAMNARCSSREGDWKQEIGDKRIDSEYQPGMTACCLRNFRCRPSTLTGLKIERARVPGACSFAVGHAAFASCVPGVHALVSILFLSLMLSKKKGRNVQNERSQPSFHLLVLNPSTNHSFIYSFIHLFIHSVIQSFSH